MRARSRPPFALPEAAAVASRLRRNPRHGRVWYAPARTEIPRPVTFDEFVDRLYCEGGPKHGLRLRSDAVETLWRGYTYLRLRAQLEDSGDYATTAEQTIVGLTFELSRRGAKAWDAMLGEGLEGDERREALLRRRGSTLRKLLDELAGAGLVVWGGERDNNGLWWRLRIRLLNPDDERPPAWEPWMRGIDPPQGESAMRQGGRETPRAPGPDVEQPPVATVDLGALYRRVEALTGHRPRLETRQVVQLRGAVRRVAAHADARPRGTPADPLEVLLAQVEHFAPQDEGALGWALARFDGYSRQLEARAGAGRSDAGRGAAQSSVSPNCAALFNQHCDLSVSVVPALACRTGARGPVDEMHDGELGAIAGEGPGMAEHRTEGEGALAKPFDFGGLTGRVAARERRLEALSGQLRAQERETVETARGWRSDAPLPVGLLTAAAQALAGGAFRAPRPWLTGGQVDRLRRGERRYARYAEQRPGCAPPTPAAVLLELIEHAPGHICHPLPWAIAQLDLLSKRMRRAHRRASAAERLPAARRRAERRRQRAGAEQADIARHYRAPDDDARRCERSEAHATAIEMVVDHLASALLGKRAPGEASPAWRAFEEELRFFDYLASEQQLAAAGRYGHSRQLWERAAVQRALRWRWLACPGALDELLPLLVDAMQIVLVGTSAGILRTLVRDRLLEGGAAPEVLAAALQGQDSAAPLVPERFDPSRAQLTDRDRERASSGPGAGSDRGGHPVRPTAGVPAPPAGRSGIRR